MAPLALLLAAAALAAPLHAASLPQPPGSLPAPKPETQLDDIALPVLDTEETKPEDAKLPEPAKDTTSDLRAQPETIPVQVVLDAEPPKLNEVDAEIRRPELDLEHPGEPQRQEHETQNPEQHADDGPKVSNIMEVIEKTRELLSQRLRETSLTVQNWLTDSEEQTGVIQSSIQSLRDTFTAQIQKVNETIHTLMMPEQGKPEASVRNFEEIDSRLKSLKEDFDSGMETMAAGVEVAAILKSSKDEEDDEDAALFRQESTAAPPAASTTVSPVNFFGQFIQNLNQTLQSGWTQITNAIQRPPPAGAQADAPADSATRPPGIGGWLSSIPNPFSNFTLPNFQAPFSSVQSVFRNVTLPPPLAQIFTRPGATTAKPAEGSNVQPPAPEQKPEGEQPVKVEQPVDGEKPAEAAALSAAPAPAPAAADQQPGPIRQFLSNIPVVQRIQNSITNRDTPRQPAEKSANQQTKGGWYYGGHGPGNSGDNNNSDGSGVSEQRSEEIKEKEPIKEEKETIIEPIKEQKEPAKEEKEPLQEKKESIKIEEPVKKEPVKEKEEPMKDEIEPIKEEIKTIEKEMEPIKEEKKPEEPKPRQD